MAKKRPEQPEEKGFIQRISERFFPPAALGGELVKKTGAKKRTPPQGRRRPPSGAPIDYVGKGKKKDGEDE